MEEIFDHQKLLVGKDRKWMAIHVIGDNINFDEVEHHNLREIIERGLASKNKVMIEQSVMDKLFTDLCRTITLADPNKQCHEAQLRYRAILGTLHDAGIRPKVPNFWSDGFNFFPIDELLKFFHKNGWENIKWVGDVDCLKCFHKDLCEYYGTGNMHGTSTEDKYYKQEKMNLTDKLLLLKVIKDATEKDIQLDNKTLDHIVLLCQANGVPFSYHFEITEDRKIITKDNKPILNVFNEIQKQMEKRISEEDCLDFGDFQNDGDCHNRCDVIEQCKKQTSKSEQVEKEEWSKLDRCSECNAKLESKGEDLICPNCSKKYIRKSD